MTYYSYTPSPTLLAHKYPIVSTLWINVSNSSPLRIELTSLACLLCGFTKVHDVSGRTLMLITQRNRAVVCVEVRWGASARALRRRASHCVCMSGNGYQCDWLGEQVWDSAALTVAMRLCMECGGVVENLGKQGKSRGKLYYDLSRDLNKPQFSSPQSEQQQQSYICLNFCPQS